MSTKHNVRGLLKELSDQGFSVTSATPTAYEVTRDGRFLTVQLDAPNLSGGLVEGDPRLDLAYQTVTHYAQASGSEGARTAIHPGYNGSYQGFSAVDSSKDGSFLVFGERHLRGVDMGTLSSRAPSRFWGVTGIKFVLSLPRNDADLEQSRRIPLDEGLSLMAA